VIILIFSNHIDKLICSELLLSHHFEKSGYFSVCNFYLSWRWLLLSWHNIWRYRLYSDVARYFDTRFAQRHRLSHLFYLFIKGSASGSFSGRTNTKLSFFLNGDSPWNTDQRQHLFGLLLLKRLLFGLLNKSMIT